MTLGPKGARIARGVLVVAVVALTLFQIALTWEFWGSFGEAKGEGQAWVFQGIGVSLAVIEAVALVAAVSAFHAKEYVKALLGVAFFAVTFGVNLTADVSAIALHSARDNELRAQAVASFVADEQIVRDAEALIAQRRTTLQEQNLDRPADALTIEVAALRGRIERLEAQGLRVSERRRQELARVEAAIILAREVEAATVRRDEARARLAEVGARPADTHAQFATLSRLAGDVGAPTTPEDVRVWLAFAIGLTVKLWLAFGLWIASSAAHKEEPEQGSESQTAEEASAQPEGSEEPKPAAEPQPTIDPLAAARERRARRMAQKAAAASAEPDAFDILQPAG